MKCLCPKCNSNIELELTEAPAEGSFEKCPECSAGFLVKKESFAKRALHKGGEIICAECGSHPGHSIYCNNCHAIYPDYYITESSSAAKKQLGKILALFSKLNRISTGTAAKTHYTNYGISPGKPLKAKGLRLPGQPAQLAAALVVVIVILSAGGYFWYQDRIETKYAQKYVRALYGIKSAADIDMKTCTRIATEWAARMTPIVPQPTATEMAYMTRANTDIQALVKLTGDAPEKFKPSNEAINKLFASYTKLHSFAIKPSGTIDSYTTTTKTLDDEFRSSARALKSGLPEKLSATLEASKKKYKQLQDF